MSDRLVDRLRRLDSGAVSDACDQLGLYGRVSTALHPMTGPVRLGGRVVTVLLGPPGEGESSDGTKRHLCAAAADAATPADVIVVAHQGRTDCAGWGGNLSRAARHRGAAGTVVHGAVRDVDEAIEVGYAVFATTATPRTARGRAEERAWGGTVSIDGIAVATGDYVIADSTGVVFVAAADIERVLAAGEAIVAKEAAMAAELDAGRPVSDVMGAGYETMLE
ncbi:MAG: RraA family protein [Acidimicrobiia bacterium]|nr:RraA family protein [Acidimicrobiia bacterium]